MTTRPHRSLGGTGLQVSGYCLGTMMFGRGGNTDEDECIGMVHRALDAGINFIDTADVYGAGHSEEIVGRALVGRRDEVIVGTKFGSPMGDDVNARGGSRRWIVRAVEASLRRLRTDHIDLYQLHRPDPATDVEETLGALSDLVRQGKVRAIGSSTFAAHEIVEAQWAAERRGSERFRSEQSPYSIFVRRIERALLPVCARHGMGVVVYQPLNSGWLAGRYTRGAPPPEGSRGSRYAASPMFSTTSDAARRKFDLLDELRALAADADIELAHLAMAFPLAHPAVSSVIVGPRTPEQLDALLSGMEVRLADDVLDRIDELVPAGSDVFPGDVHTGSSALDVRHRRNWSAG